MITDKRLRERTKELTEFLLEAPELSKSRAKKLAYTLAAEEYRKERHGVWLPDESFESKKFVRWICSECEHWQSATKGGMSDKIFYMNYCPFCGAQMEKPERGTE
ncbi:MAG: hypothetical protein J6U86_04475 [Clostridia bacterium]|nr:hypothetical protein [Clostridia bacterium]